MDDAALFAPFEALAASLLPHALPSEDGAHDIGHLRRVWRNASAIQAGEGGDLELLCAAVLLHDSVAVEKNSPLRAQASRLAAEKASGLLRGLGWDEARVTATAHAIAAHSYSANIPPETLEARILQDADRLDAIGLTGVARCFFIAGRMGSSLYDPRDPMAEHRALDDQRFALDHWETKLLRLAEGFGTATGAAMARERHEKLLAFRTALLEEA